MSGDSNSGGTTGMPKFQSDELQKAFGQAQAAYNNPPAIWQGPGVAPISDATQQSYGAGTDAAGTLNGLTGDINNGFRSSLNMDISSLPEYQNAAADITSRLSKQYHEDVVPGIDSRFAGGGAFGGSDMQLASGRAAGDLSANTGSALTSLATNLFGIQAGRSNTALSSIPGLILGNTAGYNTLKDVGAAQDTRRQAELTDTINTFNNNQNAPEDALDRYIARINGKYIPRNSSGAEGSTASSVIQGGVGGYLAGNNNLFTGLLGALGGLF